MDHKPVSSKVSGSETKASILVVDDHPLFRKGLMLLIDRQPDLRCCGEADSVASARQAIADHKPEVVVLDLRLGNEDGVELIKTLKAQFSPLFILVVSQHDEAIYAERSLRAGASGYVMKEEATEEVLKALRTVMAGDLYVSRKMAAIILRQLFQKPSEPSPGSVGLETLSNREMQIFQLLGAGKSTREIAEQILLSFKTVESHRENIKHKLGARGAAELVRRASEWFQNQTRPPGTPPPQANG